MKILLISMLRPGDFIMHIPLIRAAQKKYRKAEIHILIQDISQSFVSLLDSSVQVHIFNRTEIMQISKDPACAVTAPVHMLSALISKLQDQQFDVVMNLTHNKQSALIAGQLNAQKSYGLLIKDGRVFGLESEMAKKFNNEFVDSKSYPFHYVDSLAKICELTPIYADASIKPVSRMKIGFQFLSSDSKKDFPMDLAADYVRKAKQMGFDVAVMAASFELKQLENHMACEDIKLIKLQDLASFIKSCDIIVSVDTLQLHLAGQLGIPTLGLHLGSSNQVKTGSTSQITLSLSSKADCHPCQHSQACPYANRKCQDFTVKDFEIALSSLTKKIKNNLNNHSTDESAKRPNNLESL